MYFNFFLFFADSKKVSEVEIELEQNDKVRKSLERHVTINEDPTTVKETEERDEWDNKCSFFLSALGFAVGLGNVWRFPFTAYENGGGAFLIPYLIILLLIGRPMYFLELSMGQFSGQRATKVWEMVPLLRGIGFAQTIASFYLCSYYCFY